MNYIKIETNDDTRSKRRGVALGQSAKKNGR